MLLTGVTFPLTNGVEILCTVLVVVPACVFFYFIIRTRLQHATGHRHRLNLKTVLQIQRASANAIVGPADIGLDVLSERIGQVQEETLDASTHFRIHGMSVAGPVPQQQAQVVEHDTALVVAATAVDVPHALSSEAAPIVEAAATPEPLLAASSMPLIESAVSSIEPNDTTPVQSAPESQNA